MRVLFIVNSCCTPITTNKRFYTGYDYIVSDIAERLSRCCQLEMFSLNPCSENCLIGEVPVRSCVNYKHLLKNIKIGEVQRYIRILFRSLPNIRMAIKNLLWYLSVETIDKLIKKNDYDIIHIHGVSFGCYISSLAPSKNNKPFLFTMHGLLSYDAPGISRIDKLSERAALEVIKNNDFYATTVSSGTKRIPCDDMGIDSNKLIVVNNAVKSIPSEKRDYWIDKYPHVKGKKIFIGVGTIGSRKNQIQLLRAFLLLPQDIRNSVAVILAGMDNTNGEIESFLIENKLKNHVFLCGFVNKADLSNLYAIADFNVMLSISEGFGLSMIEAASYGIPSLTFSDLDAVKDIYSPNFMLLLDDRSDETVAKGIIKMISTEWDKEEIIKESQKFNEDIYLRYMDVYKMILEKGTNLIDPQVITDALGL